MPVKSNVGAFTATVRKVGQAAVDGQKKAATAAANVIKTAATSSMESVAPGLRLRNVGKNGSQIKISQRATGDGNATTVTVRASGAAAAILDTPSRSHLIGVGRSTKRVKTGFSGPARPGRGAGHPMRIGDEWFQGPFHHPGTKGKQSFQKGAKGAVDEARAAFVESLTSTVQKAANS